MNRFYFYKSFTKYLQLYCNYDIIIMRGDRYGTKAKSGSD